MRITTKGQVTIPIAIRRRHGLLPNTEVVFREDDSGVRLEKAPPSSAGRGRRLIESMRGKSKIGMTTDEIMALTRGDE